MSTRRGDKSRRGVKWKEISVKWCQVERKMIRSPGNHRALICERLGGKLNSEQRRLIEFSEFSPRRWNLWEKVLVIAAEAAELIKSDKTTPNES